MDGIAAMLHLELVIQNFKLCLYFLHCCGVSALDGKKVIHHPLEILAHLLHSLFISH
jgi:hypothetical protein